MAKVGEYKLLKLLGAGSFSKVFLGEHLTTENKCAVKIMQRHKSKHGKEFNELALKEIKLCQKLKHK
jgi:serine/threonine protein kinase